MKPACWGLIRTPDGASTGGGPVQRRPTRHSPFFPFVVPEAAEPRAIAGERRAAMALSSLHSRLLLISLEPNNAYVHASNPYAYTRGDAHRSCMRVRMQLCTASWSQH